MFKLVAKDLKVSFYFLLLILLLYLLHAPINLKLSAGYLLTSLAMIFFVATGVTFIDWHYDTDLFIASLPLGRSTVVRARYLTAGIAILFGCALCSCYGVVLDSLIDRDRMTLSSLKTVEGIFVFAGASIFLVSLFFPLYFCWGCGKGWAAVGTSVIILVGGLSLLTTGIVLDPPIEPTSARNAGLLTDMELTLMQGCHRLRQATGTAIFLIGGIVSVICVVLTSMGISIRFYLQRDL